MTTLDKQLRWSATAMMVLSLLLMVVSMLLMGAASSALAAIPSTADYRNATTPLVTGRVLMVSEHDMVVSTEQGNEIPLTLDTRTMVPADLSRDMMVRVEFHYLPDGTRYAKRIIPIRRGQKVTRELAYSRERDDDEAEVRYAAAYASGEPRPSRVVSVTNQRLDRAIVPIPSTDEYHVATQAMVVGRVVTVTDHKIVVDTDQRERVALEMDSRTLVPTDLQSGIGVRIEYRAVDNGARLATRVVPIRYDRVDGGYEADISDPQEDFDATPGFDASTAEYVGDADDDDAFLAQNTVEGDGDVNDAGHPLPRTSSNEPILVLLGLLAVGTGAALMLRRASLLG